MKSEMLAARRLTHGNDHYFFGYYDVSAYSRNGNYHLAHKVGFWDRLPEANDVAEIGLIERQTGKFEQLAQTTAWNFQQGAMLQWHPSRPDEEIIFNVRYGEQFAGMILNIRSGATKSLDAPVANIDPTGRYALSVHFGRMFVFRPGYGYASLKDTGNDLPHPERDGVFIVDLCSGRAKLLLSLQQIWEFVKPYLPHRPSNRLLINHITFNPNCKRFLMLVRYFADPGERWETAAITANLDGSDLYMLSQGFTTVSHYHWKSPEQLVIYAAGPEGVNLYEWTDKTAEKRPVDPAYFREDGHCSYSPNRQWLLYDSYPDGESKRHLYLYHLERKLGMPLGSFHSQPLDTDLRCDLHPRWNADGTRISFDSTHEGRRHIYEMDIAEAMAAIG